MSVVFEGIVVRCGAKAALHLRQMISTIPRFGVGWLEADVVVVYRNDPRDEAHIDAGVEQLAASLSRELGTAVVVWFDSRVGYRASLVFVQGQETASYSEDDERYVLLDDDGHPLVGGEQCSLTQLDDALEYETLTSAIELGLAHLGNLSWPALLNFMARC
jgi:hypothetical protein